MGCTARRVCGLTIETALRRRHRPGHGEAHRMTDNPDPEVDPPVRAGYDRWAGVYHHAATPPPPREGPLARAAAGNGGGLAALDLGCGPGRHALWLAAAGARVTAVD